MKQTKSAGRSQAECDAISTVIDLVRQNLCLLAELVQRHEVARQESTNKGRIVRKPADVIRFLGPELADLAQEQLRVILLNTKNQVLGASLVYQGGLNSIVVRLADCYREAVRVNAAAILLVHNHPSGDPEPSGEDVRVTREAAQAGELLGIDLLDHVIVGDRAFVSLRERGFYRPGPQVWSATRKKSADGDTPTWEVQDA